MKLRSASLVLAVEAMVIVWLIGVAQAARAPQGARGAAPPQGGRGATPTPQGGRATTPQTPAPQAARGAAPRPQMSEEVFKNVTVLTGIPVDEFMGTMGLFSAALSMCCGECHDNEHFEVDTPRKRTARRMTTMVKEINRANFNGRQVVTCWTCHRNRDKPVVTPTLDSVYGEANPIPDDILPQVPGMPSVDSILDKYIQALGGAQRLASFTSYVAKGTSEGYVTGGSPAEFYAKAPDQRMTIVHTANGDIVRAFDGREGSIMTPLTSVRDYDFTGGELEGVRLDARMAFPGRIKEFLTNWRVNLPTEIDGRSVDVVQGSGPNGLVATFYFDKQTGLLNRMIRYANSAVGRVPTQTDYADYRPVAGVMVPFRWTFSWLDGRDRVVLTDVQPNVPIDAAKFARPVPRSR
jgi:photosynthetic reaction center cytochrome c subunit